ncbi:MAG: hypothetical protein QME44_04490 [Thermodesulfobacteriota bacterium]|nr:hypothetical protein [Thermodesulfobacteriota bacterium]
MNKICPMMSKVYVDTNGDWPTPQLKEITCKTGYCAWWDIGNNQCAIVDIAHTMDALYDDGMPNR